MKSFSRLPLALGAGAALVLAAPGVLSAPAVAQTSVAVRPAVASSIESSHTYTIFVKVNELRASLGLKPVTRYVEIDTIAQNWSEYMSAYDYFEHRTDWSVFPEGRGLASENIAYAYDEPGKDVGAELFEQWLHSPGHYTNMVNPEVNAIGVGLSFNPSTGKWFGTQNFAHYADPAGAGLTPVPGGFQPGVAGAVPDAPAGGSNSVTKPEEKKPDAAAPGAAAPSEPKKKEAPAPLPAPAPADDSKEAPAPPADKPKADVPKKQDDAAQDPAKSGKGAGKNDSKVIDVQSSKTDTGSQSGKPEVVVAAPEKSKAADGTTRLPATGVSSLAALGALGLAGAGTTVFVIRSRRRA